jgi:outer membrane receptor protein involved in Fe transport
MSIRDERGLSAAIGRSWRLAAVSVIVAGLGHVLSAQAPAPAQNPSGQQAPPKFEETVEVVGATPIHGLGIDRNKIPSNIQTATADALERTGANFIGEQMLLGVPGVQVNEATTNPFQPDLQFRGFVGSPLLGLPQGLAVYQNGVRLNEPFGDTVNWDLLPSNAIAGINLMPGSNPLFGLNALGGALSIQTKTGFSHPGHAVDVSGGSFGRYLVQAASGGHTDRVSYFVAGSTLSEDGWRDFSPSRVRQLFGDVEWRLPSTTLNATVTSGINRLIGNGAAPIELLEEDRSAIFTYPDETKTKMTLLTFRGRHNAGSNVALDGMFFYRRASIRTFNGDDSDYDECEDEAFEEFLCSDEGEGEPVEDQFEKLIPVDEDDELDGTNNTSKTATNGWGGAFQATVTRPLSARPNHFVTGVTFDGGRSNYEADTEIARLTDERGTVGTGLFDEEAVVRLRTTVRHTGLFAADFFTVAPRLTLMGAARFNHSVVTLRDQVGTELDGDHSFSRLNPAVGLTYDLPREVTAYGSFSMSSRVPAPSELSCADPDDPCRLPNAFVADPPLEQVVAQTWEGGIRGRRQGLSWNASMFRTATSDDIMFISSGPLTNTGHFENVGDTLRQGIELGASGVVNAVRWGVAYSFLRARFDTPLTLSSPNHPDEEDGEIDVEAGSRIPGVPQHNLKANLSATIKRLTLGGNLVTTSNQYLRGDEANLLPAIDGFAVVNLTADYAIANHIRLTGRVTNLFGSEHATFGLLGEADEVLGDDYEDPRFLSPGAPRAAWVGVEFSFR